MPKSYRNVIYEERCHIAALLKIGNYSGTLAPIN